MSNTVEFDGVCLRETDAALLVEIDGEEYWMPKAQVDDASDVQTEGDIGLICISEWIATQKGLL